VNTRTIVRLMSLQDGSASRGPGLQDASNAAFVARIGPASRQLRTDYRRY
jgi:hypothetical protein